MQLKILTRDTFFCVESNKKGKKNKKIGKLRLFKFRSTS